MNAAALVHLNPYPGLAPFQEQDASQFFGREKEVEDILDRLASRRLLAVIGVSGCGKSSLIRAGVIPVLSLGVAENLPGSWLIHVIRPGNHPLEALREALKADSAWPTKSFELVERAQEVIKRGQKLLLVVDQFEELFRFRAEAMGRDAGNEASLFVNLLLDAADQREVPVYILLTMRTDYLGECAQFRGLPEALNDGYYLVPRLTRLQQQDAIERPLEEQGTQIVPALVQRLLNDSAENPDQLPVLQHVLKRLWENWEARGVAGPIGMPDYDAVGGWKNAINNVAEGILNRFPAEEAGIERLFQWITERGSGEKPIRRPRPLDECVQISGLSLERLSEIIRAFQKAGLLCLSELSGTSQVDLTHESVMWHWSRLDRWIILEAARETQLKFLLQSAQSQLPLVGLALESALQLRSKWQARKLQLLRYVQEQELEQIEAWVVRSKRLNDAQRRRRWWILGMCMSGLIALAFVAVWFSGRERRRAEARELSAWAARSLGDDPERSLILGLHSWSTQKEMVGGLEQFLHEAALQSKSRLTLSGHKGYLWNIAWSPDGTKLATAGQDNTAKVWEVSTGRELLTLRGHTGAVRSVGWSPDGTKLATSSFDKTAKIWQAHTGRELLTLSGHQDTVWSIAWSPDGTRLATASFDKTAKVWEAHTGRELFNLSGHKDAVWSVVWSPDSTRLATASDDRTAKVWEASTGRELLSLSRQKNAVWSIGWSPDGTRLATAGGDKIVKVWEAGTGAELLTLAGHQDSIWSVVWSPDGTKLATASQDNTARVWEVGTGQESFTLRGHQDSIWSIAWSPDGTKLATASWDETGKVWDLQAGGELLTLRSGKDAARSVGWSPDGTKLATAGDDKTGKVWEASTGRELLTLRGHSEAVRSIAWSPDGTKLATASFDKTAKVWEAYTGRELLTLRGHNGPVWTVAWSPDGTKLATTGDDNMAKVWEAVTGRELLTLRGHQAAVWSVAWSPDGKGLATGSADNVAKIWEATRGRELLSLRGHQGSVLSVAWSPDGRKLATTSDDKMAKIWEATRGRELLTLRGHEAAVWSVAWSPDGTKLATASDDKMAKVWEAGTGQELLTLRGHQGAVFSVAWRRNPERLASAGVDGIAQVYAIDSNELLHVVRGRITRNLTSEECKRYMNIDHCPSVPPVP